jgi:peroxiredoxin
VADTVLFGISSGGASSKRRFLEANEVKTVELLIDTDNKVRKSWDVPKALFGKCFPA